MKVFLFYPFIPTQDIIVHSVSALLLFAAAVSLAYYADFSKDLAGIIVLMFQ